MSWDDILKGTNGADYLNGGGGDDFIQGRAGGDTIDGGTGNDQLHGDSGDDHIRGGAGDDFINGGLGIDTAYYSGSVFHYSHYRLGEEFFLAHIAGTAGDGHDRLIHVERLVFADAVIDLTQNNAPIAFDDTAATNEDVGTYSSGSAGVLANDFDWEGSSLSVTPGTFSGTYGKLVLNADGTYTYTPYASAQGLAQGQTVQDSFSYTVSDGSLTDTGTLTINLAGLNDDPVASADTASAGENSAVTIDVLANDSDVDNGAVLTVTAASGPAGKGSVTIVANQVKFDPGTDFDHLAQGASEAVLINYTIQDEHGASSSSTITVTVTGSNDGPVAAADAASGHENQLLTVDVLANDSDVDDGAVLTVVSASAPAGKGSASIVGNQLRFDPGSGFDHLADGASETVVVSYTIEDEHGASASSTVTIIVTGTNDGPVANVDSASTGENSAVTVDVLGNDTDADDGAVLTVVAASGPAGQGSVSIVGNQVKFDPGSDFDQLAQGATQDVVVNYTIEDEHGASASSTVTISVTGANDGPVAVADSAAGHENQILTVDVLGNDSDVDDGAVLTIVAASAPAGKGSASIVGNQVRFDPGSHFDHLADGASETVVVSYTIEDEHGASASSTVTITVTGTNDGPIANADSASTGENSAVIVNVRANDTDADDGAVLTVVAASGPAGQGSVSIAGGQVKFDPGSDFDHLAAGESAEVEIAYTVEDEHGASSSSTLTVTVNGANDAPTIDAAGTSASGSASELANGAPNEGTQVHQASGTIAFEDVDLSDTHSASVTPQGGSYLGTFALDAVDQNGDGVGWDFSVSDAALDELDEGEVVTQTYTIEIDDGNGGTASQDVTITLTGAGDNQPPDAVNDSYSATGNVTLTVNAAGGVLANDSDDSGVGDGPDETPVTAYDSASANGGSVTMNPDGSFSYTSAPGFSGSDSFTYTITDADGESDTATVTVTVTGSVWFIDNSAVTSANLGTQADPYTSLAAFNAAQGTPNGPAAGETVYLREGTGTYAEADGINLLSGQTLIGGGQDLVIGGDTVELGTGRPTIVATGAGNHGVQVATNNNVSGLDIGNTAGAGISDSNGTVGNLTVTDVGIFGTGRIVDIDQGGTVNIALNSATSTGSTGGAIDLNGLSGSFTVTGATTITGTHSGGGVDVTNGTNLTVAFEGTLTASTGSATAINYTGSSGGGLTVGGTGNSIVTTGGIAVNLAGVSNVAIADATIASTGNYAILGSSVAGFELSDSTVTGAAAKDATIAFTNLTGTADLLGNTIGGGGGDNVRVVNSSGSLDLTIADGTDQAVIGLNDSANGDDGVYVETGGSASLTLTIDGVDFLGARSDLVQTVANGSSSQDVSLTDNVFANAHTNTASGGGGVFIGGGGAGSNISVDYVIEGNSFTGADGSALSAYFAPAAGTIRGHIADNVIGENDGIAGSQGSAGGGDGIFVGLEKLDGSGTATHSVTIDGNEIYDVAFGLGGINVRSGSAGGTGAIVEATVTDNIVDESGAFTAFYAIVGGTSAGDTSKLGIDMSDNVWDNGDSPFGNNAVTFDQISEDAHYYFPGYSGSADGEYSAGAGTASADLHAFLTGKGNVTTNGGFPLHPGGVDASLVSGVTGDALVLPVWFG